MRVFASLYQYAPLLAFWLTHSLGIHVACAAAIEPSSGPLTLNQAFEVARAHSPAPRSAVANQDEGRWKQVEAFSAFLPRLDFTGNHYFAQKFQVLSFDLGAGPTLFPFIYPRTLGELDSSLLLFDGMQSLERYRASSLDADAADLETEWAEFSLRETVRLNYYQALAAERLLSVAEQNVKTLEDHLQQTRDLLESGSATHYDVLRVEVQLDEARSDRMATEDDVIVARKKLAQTIGLENDILSISGDLPSPSASAVPRDLQPSVENRKDLRAKDLEAESAEKAHAAAYSHWMPKISLGGQYQFYNNVDGAISSADHYHTAYGVGVFVTWNLFAGGGSYARQKEAADEAIKSQAVADQQRLQAPYDFNYWKRRYFYSATNYEAHLADVKKATESVRLATLGQRAGTRTSTEVLDAELDLFRARAGVIRAQLGASQALINLELATGRNFGS